jgi:hypothetical protein
MGRERAGVGKVIERRIERSRWIEAEHERPGERRREQKRRALFQHTANVIHPDMQAGLDQIRNRIGAPEVPETPTTTAVPLKGDTAMSILPDRASPHEEVSLLGQSVNQYPLPGHPRFAGIVESTDGPAARIEDGDLVLMIPAEALMRWHKAVDIAIAQMSLHQERAARHAAAAAAQAPRPYAEHIGHRVDVMTRDFDRVRGVLLEVTDQHLVLNCEEHPRAGVPLREVRHVARAEGSMHRPPYPAQPAVPLTPGQARRTAAAAQRSEHHPGSPAAAQEADRG